MNVQHYWDRFRSLPAWKKGAIVAAIVLFITLSIGNSSIHFAAFIVAAALVFRPKYLANLTADRGEITRLRVSAGAVAAVSILAYLMAGA